MKKIICLLLCLMMVIPATVVLADTTIIDKVYVTLAIPKAGSKVSDQSLPPRPAGVSYKVGNVYYGDETHEMTSSEAFEAGKHYFALILMMADDHCYFDKNTKFDSNLTIVDAMAVLEGDAVTTNVALMEVEFTVPAGPTEKVTLSKLKSVKLTALSAKKLKVSWKKLSSKDQKKIQKIQIQYSTDKTFKTYKTKWAKKGASSVKISGLKKNTKYYIRIRAYKKSGGVVYVSKWVTKNKKTKKK